MGVKMIKAVLFDFFGVISDEVAPPWFSRYFNEEDAVRLKAQIFERADLGLISEEETYAEMSEISGIPKDRIREEFYSLVKINRELVEYIKSLREKYKVYLLSNAPEGFLRRVLQDNDLYPLFDGLFISCEIGLKKPSGAYYVYALKNIGIRPEEAFFTDDNPENISAARAIGINAEVFTGTRSLKRALLAHGIR